MACKFARILMRKERDLTVDPQIRFLIRNLKSFFVLYVRDKTLG